MKENETKSKPKLTPGDFVHLHNHTQYSLLDGLTKVPALIDLVKENGMSAVAITDHGTLSGAIEFYKTAKNADVKPLIGMETYVAPRTHQDKDPAKDKTPFHLTLIAMNNTGYRNLMRLSTIANLEGFYYRPRVDHELLEKYNEGLIVLSGCIGGEIGDALRQNQYEKAKKAALWYKKVFGDRYYLEVQDHGHPEHTSMWQEQVEVTELTFKLANETNIPCVVTCDAHYLKHEDQDAHEILLCVQTGAFLTDEGRMSLKDFELHVTDPKEIIKRWGKDHPEVITNTKAIADRCNIEIELGKILIPKFPLPRGMTEKSYLRKLVYRGLAWRYGGKTEKEVSELDEAQAKEGLDIDVIVRAEYELSVVNEMGFNGYFLIISDFVNWGKDQGIVFGPGRGSAAGSIIAYSLKITELDPIEYDLLFERFLNPDRISMPDIDIDIQDSRRDEVIKYCVEKYGKDRVANIVTFGRMAARNAVRDVARVLHAPYSDADRLAKMIPPPVQGRHIPLQKSLEDNADLKKEYETNDQAKRVFDLAVQLEGTIRSHGVHAAGVVIAPDDIVTYAPLEMAQKGVVATQYSMGPIEDLGLLKMDFLGLSNLTIIKNTLRIVKKVYGKDIDISTIPLDDEKTYALLAKGDTTGVFQLESAGMKRYLKQLKPSEFEDIVAMVALYRPGPMQWIDDFISRKHGLKDIEYMHPAMESSLKSTYGVIVYQEQVMQISKDMCGFSGGQADTLRKAIGKKDPAVLARLKNDFIEGAVKKVNAEKKVMQKFWEQLEDFAAYCFNKSHAACYGLIAYQTAYLKAHYPDAFMAALMTSDYDNTDRLAIEIDECKNLGIQVLSPDVNESFGEFAVVPGENKIRFGLNAVKNVGAGAVEEILRAREEEGGFKTLDSYLSRVNIRISNRKTIESLIKSGALDRFGDRGVLFSNLDNLMSYAGRKQKQLDNGQTDLFGGGDSSEKMDDDLLSLSLETKSDTEVNGMRARLQWERELLGIYLSDHPLNEYETILEKITMPINTLANDRDNESVTIGGAITELKEIIAKNGKKMAFARLADKFGEVELIIFPNVYEKVHEILVRDEVILVRGKVTTKGQNDVKTNDVKVLANEIKKLSLNEKISTKITNKKAQSQKKERANTSPAADTQQKLYLRLRDSEDQEMLIELKKIVDNNNGSTEVILVLGEENNKQAIKLPLRVSASTVCLEQLGNIIGPENVKLS